MGTAYDILKAIYISEDVERCKAKLKPKHLADDIVQHCFTELFSKPEDFILDLHNRGKLKSYIVRMLHNTSYFTDTPFTKQYGNGKEIPTENFNDLKADELTEDMHEEVSRVLDRMHFFRKGILELYVEMGTYREVSEATGIPLTTICNTIKDARKEIKKKVCK